MSKTTYARAALEYDEEHEQALLAAITTAIFEASVSDARMRRTFRDGGTEGSA